MGEQDVYSLPDAALVDTRAAAKILGLSAATLQTWRCLGRGPAYRRLDRAIRYSVGVLRAWADRNTITPGSQAE
ncbi:MAG: helix-turn-helix domain-containing protein [Thermoanaerobaculia bacterium]|nr:helix-turn-helix domain-containing protein [Thermoanaerobaculia bacterium]